MDLSRGTLFQTRHAQRAVTPFVAFPDACLPRHVFPAQCGPRFELKPYQIRLGTVDQAHAENEWVLRSYTRSAKKQRLADPDAKTKG